MQAELRIVAGSGNWVLAGLVSLLVAGCSPSGSPRYHLAGQVTVAGRPVPSGVIFFEPDAVQKNDGQPGYAYIKDGRFDTREQGQPTIGGPHYVRIHAFDGQPGEELPLGKMLVPEYTVQVDLERSDATRDFEIPSAGS
jgi:hypothetical protein